MIMRYVKRSASRDEKVKKKLKERKERKNANKKCQEVVSQKRKGK